jgi:hypothetical protein
MDKDNVYILLGRTHDASLDLAHLAINRGKEIERLRQALGNIIQYAHKTDFVVQEAREALEAHEE